MILYGICFFSFVALGLLLGPVPPPPPPLDQAQCDGAAGRDHITAADAAATAEHGASVLQGQQAVSEEEWGGSRGASGGILLSEVEQQQLLSEYLGRGSGVGPALGAGRLPAGGNPIDLIRRAPRRARPAACTASLQAATKIVQSWPKLRDLAQHFD